MITADYHTHTLYSHGKCTVAQVARIAFERGVKTLAISEHGKGNVFYGVSDKAFIKMRREIEEQKKLYDGKMHIMMGIEADFLGNGKTDIPREIEFDIVLAGYHRGIIPKNGFSASALLESFTSRCKADLNTDEILRTFDRYPQIRIMTHPNEYIRINVDRLSKEAAARNILLEINNRHVTFTKEELMLSASNGARFVISSDGHTADEMCRFENATALAKEAGVLSRVVNFNEESI